MCMNTKIKPWEQSDVCELLKRLLDKNYSIRIKTRGIYSEARVVYEGRDANEIRKSIEKIADICEIQVIDNGLIGSVYVCAPGTQISSRDRRGLTYNGRPSDITLTCWNPTGEIGEICTDIIEGVDGKLRTYTAMVEEQVVLRGQITITASDYHEAKAIAERMYNAGNIEMLEKRKKVQFGAARVTKYEDK